MTSPEMADTAMALIWYRYFKRNVGLNLDFTALQTSLFRCDVNISDKKAFACYSVIVSKSVQRINYKKRQSSLILLE